MEKQFTLEEFVNHSPAVPDLLVNSFSFFFIKVN